jgi:hypothetical protein
MSVQALSEANARAARSFGGGHPKEPTWLPNRVNHVSPQLDEFGADLRSASPFDAGAPTEAGVSRQQKCEYTGHCFGGVNRDLDSGVGEVDHVARSHCKPSVQTDPRIRATLPALGFALVRPCTSEGKHRVVSDDEPRRCEDLTISEVRLTRDAPTGPVMSGIEASECAYRPLTADRIASTARESSFPARRHFHRTCVRRPIFLILAAPVPLEAGLFRWLKWRCWRECRHDC